ncbi:MAG: hypothetical protein V3V31_03775 [Methylococcales bacterium]
MADNEEEERRNRGIIKNFRLVSEVLKLIISKLDKIIESTDEIVEESRAAKKNHRG